MRRFLFSSLCALASLALVAPVVAAPRHHRKAKPASASQPPIRVPCTDQVDAATRFSLPVGPAGEQATGFWSVPAVAPKGIVVFSHGYGHSSFSWQEHMRRVSTTLGVIAVAMDGRGLRTVGVKSSGVPDTRGWPVVTGAEDGIAAAKLFQAACPMASTIVNFGVSMGGNTSGLMQAEPVRRADRRTPLFDYWVDVEGVSDLAYLYSVARAAAPFNASARNGAEDIAEAMGGTLERFPDRYIAASPAHRTRDISRSGVKGVVTIHGLDDGLVSPNHEAQLRSGLLAHNVPVQSFTVITKDAASEQDTSITGTAVTNVDKSYRSPLAGHGSERSTVHLVIKTGFERLDAIFRGQPPTCTRSHVVDGQLAVTVPAPAAC